MLEQSKTGRLPLEVSGLRFSIEDRLLIDGVDLALHDFGITMVMGFNGAGKSLLLRLLHGMIEPQQGTIRWNGKLLDTAERAKQAMVFQKPVLLRRSVAANITFAIKIARKSGRIASKEINTEALLDHVDLTEFSKRPARLLSGGEQQRLALARALASQPQVLFLDEPTASLDPASVLAIERIVRDVSKTGTKVIFVTHDRGQAKRLGQDIVFLHNGKVAEHSAADAFFNAPKSEPAKAYLEGRIFS